MDFQLNIPEFNTFMGSDIIAFILCGEIDEDKNNKISANRWMDYVKDIIDKELYILFEILYWKTKKGRILILKDLSNNFIENLQVLSTNIENSQLMKTLDESHQEFKTLNFDNKNTLKLFLEINGHVNLLEENKSDLTDNQYIQLWKFYGSVMETLKKNCHEFLKYKLLSYVVKKLNS